MARLRNIWDDMADTVVHFTKNKNGRNYDTIMSILSDQELRPGGKFGIGASRAPNPQSQEAVCFSEIPPGLWNRLVERRKTKFGVAFKKDTISEKGGGAIWYARKGSPHWSVLQSMMDEARCDPDADIWKITPMIDAPGVYRGRDYFFEWEREWRHIGRMQFHEADVAFLMVPEESHDAASAFFSSSHASGLGPSYTCPIVDPLWERARIEECFGG